MKKYVIYHEGSRLFVGSYEECEKYAEAMKEYGYDLSTLVKVEESTFEEEIALVRLAMSI